MMKRIIFIVLSLLLLGLSIWWNISNLVKIFEGTINIYKNAAFFGAILLSTLAVIVLLTNRQRQTNKLLRERLTTWTKLSYHVNQVGDEVFNELPIGIIALDEDLEIKWANGYSETIFGSKIIDHDLLEISKEMHNNILNRNYKTVVKINNEMYDMEYKEDFMFIYLFNETEREQIKQKYKDHLPVLGIFYLDNLDETMTTLDMSEQSTIKGEYLAAISDWVARFDAYLKTYGDERLVMIAYRHQLEQMIEEGFSVLDQIRTISQDNQIRISLSIGIASWEVSYDELGIYAQNAIDLAEKRGGDQVVVNIQNEKIAYFGARTDALTKSSRVGARINAQTIKDYISKANNVYIMGHNLTDTDSFGSMIAMHHLSSINNRDSYMIFDEDKVDNTVLKIYENLLEVQPGFLNNIVKGIDIENKIDDKDLLIIVDTQTPKIAMHPDLLESFENIIVIDHHRVGDIGFDATFSYIEPHASSTIELIIEMIEFYQDEEIEFTPIEASIMYAGLVVDTNHFSYRTGTRTFEVAYKLREFGADPSIVKSWLRKDMKTVMIVNEFISTLDLHLEQFAFLTTEKIVPNRVLLAQISDEALLIDNINAAFTIGMLDENTVGVSARSYKDVNVQLLMEAIGGGGHMNSAAAQIKGKTVEQIKEQIKEYLSLEYGQGGEDVKIILLEDVKGRGLKDDIIEVANGFGQFLIKQNKALLATDENLQKLHDRQEQSRVSLEKQVELMKKVKEEIDGKKVTVSIQLGHDGKMFGSVTTRQIAEEFESQHGIQLDRKKLEVSSEINSIGIYSASITLYKDIKATFEVQVIEK